MHDPPPPLPSRPPPMAMQSTSYSVTSQPRTCARLPLAASMTGPKVGAGRAVSALTVSPRHRKAVADSSLPVCLESAHRSTTDAELRGLVSESLWALARKDAGTVPIDAFMGPRFV